MGLKFENGHFWEIRARNRITHERYPSTCDNFGYDQ